MRTPPQGRVADEHCAVVRVKEAAEARDGTVDERHEWLRVTANHASHLAHDAEVEVVPYATLAAVLEGIDGGRGGEIAQVS
jgi:hypothetical protein